MKVVANRKTNEWLWKCKNVWYISSKLQLIPLLGTATKMIQITWYLSVKIGLNIYTFKTVVKCSLWVNFTAFLPDTKLVSNFPFLSVDAAWSYDWGLTDCVRWSADDWPGAKTGDVVSDMDMTLVHCSRLSWCNQCIFCRYDVSFAHAAYIIFLIMGLNRDKCKIH